MTVRQVFYQLVARGVVPKDENAGYRPVQTQILRMRKEGLLDWSFIADNTRWMRKPNSYRSVDEAIDDMHRTYRRDLWQSQQVRIEIWLEKTALAGVVQQATARWDVPLMVTSGTSSITFLHSAANVAAEAWEVDEVETVVYALYDFDAAGRRAARSVEKGLREFAPDVPITFELLAITEWDIETHNLPTRPAKKTDPEAHKWGDGAVELDALPPNILVSYVESAIETHVDLDALEMESAAEASEREFLRRISGAS
jgi:hypothetical protein